MIALTTASSNEVQQKLCGAVMQHGHSADPRGMPTRELLGVGFVVRNPRHRLTTLPERRWSASLAVAELAWNVRGDSAVAPLAFYSSQWLDFAEPDGTIRGSCYGAKIFRRDEQGRSQWENVRRLLAAEPTTRRAVMSFRDESDVSAPTSDLSCTNSLQFILRDGRLHAFVSMRSNDLIWGVPYDIFLFTTLQEQMSVELGVELGEYHHSAASMHVYARHFELAQAMAAAPLPSDVGAMPPIESPAALRRLAQREEALRLGVEGCQPVTPYETFCLGLLQRHRRFQMAA